MDINETAKRISDFIGGDYTAESIASMMNIQIDLHLQAFGSEEEFGEIIPEQLRSDLDLIRGNERDMADVLDSVDKKFLHIGMDSDYAGKYLKEAISELESYRGYANDDIKRAEVLLNTEQALEQNDNMIDGVINNEADSREIPGTYDEAEKEADEAEHERIIKDMKEDSELEKAKEFISEFTQSEYGSEPNFSDLSAVGLAYTTIDYPEFLKEAGVTDYDKEFEIQVDANLIDKEIITYIDGDELLTEKFDSLADMNEFLEVLDFNDLIHIGDAGWQKIADWEIDREAMAALDAHEAEFGADGSRVFPHLNDEPGEKTEIFVSLSGNDVSKELMDHLLNNNYDAHYRQKGEQTVLVVDSDVITEVQTILNDRNIPHSLEPISFGQINENIPVMSLTGQPISHELQDVLKDLDNGKYVDLETIYDTPELRLALTMVSDGKSTDMLAGREDFRKSKVKEMLNFGSATVDENGKTQYNGSVDKDARLDIIIGLPASGKSSAIVDNISQEFHSKLNDNDEAKKMIPEFNKGWGANIVHKESQRISDTAYIVSLNQKENIVLPKVGADAQKLFDSYIKPARDKGYTVNVHFVDLPREKALGRMIRRFADKGRFLPPDLIDKYCNEREGNRIAKTYEELKNNPEFAKEIRGFSKWNNDVKRGEKPILMESINLSGRYIDNARTQQKGEEHDENRGKSNGNDRRSTERNSNPVERGNEGEAKENDAGIRGSRGNEPHGYESSESNGHGEHDSGRDRQSNDSILSEAGIKRGERLPESMVNYLNEQAVSPREPQPALVGSSQITVSISSKFVSDPFTAKDGKEYVRVKIPNEDRNDKSSWASIVIPPEQVSKNEDTGRAELTLKADGYSTLVKSEYKGHDENGKAVFEQKKSKISNAELKKRVERTEPKNIGNALKANKEKAAEINKQREKSSEHNKSVNRNNGRE